MKLISYFGKRSPKVLLIKYNWSTSLRPAQSASPRINSANTQPMAQTSTCNRAESGGSKQRGLTELIISLRVLKMAAKTDVLIELSFMSINFSQQRKGVHKIHVSKHYAKGKFLTDNKRTFKFNQVFPLNFGSTSFKSFIAKLRGWNFSNGK